MEHGQSCQMLTFGAKYTKTFVIYVEYNPCARAEQRKMIFYAQNLRSVEHSIFCRFATTNPEYQQNADKKSLSLFKQFVTLIPGYQH